MAPPTVWPLWSKPCTRTSHRGPVQGIVFSVKQSAVTLGGLLAGLILPPLATHVGWQAALCIAASVALVAIALIHPLRRTLDDDRALTIPLLGNVFGNIKLVWDHPPYFFGRLHYATIQVTLFALYASFLFQKVGYSLIEAGWLYAVMQGSGSLQESDGVRSPTVGFLLGCSGMPGSGAVVGTSILGRPSIGVGLAWLRYRRSLEPLPLDGTVSTSLRFRAKSLKKTSAVQHQGRLHSVFSASWWEEQLQRSNAWSDSYFSF